jgi:hypothetical protein
MAGAHRAGIAALAGEVLVSSAVRDPVVESGLRPRKFVLASTDEPRRATMNLSPFAIVCALLIIVGSTASPSLAQQKTAKECQDE